MNVEEKIMKKIMIAPIAGVTDYLTEEYLKNLSLI